MPRRHVMSFYDKLNKINAARHELRKNLIIKMRNNPTMKDSRHLD